MGHGRTAHGSAWVSRFGGTRLFGGYHSDGVDAFCLKAIFYYRVYGAVSRLYNVIITHRNNGLVVCDCFGRVYAVI